MWPNPQFPAELVLFTEEILNGKLLFLYSVWCSIFWRTCVILVTLHSEPEEYSESCQAYMMQRFLNEPRHIQNPSISRTLAYFETVIYSEPCPLCNNKNFIHFKKKRIETPDKFKTLAYSELKTFKMPWIFKL